MSQTSSQNCLFHFCLVCHVQLQILTSDHALRAFQCIHCWKHYSLSLSLSLSLSFFWFCFSLSTMYLSSYPCKFITNYKAIIIFSRIRSVILWLNIPVNMMFWHFRFRSIIFSFQHSLNSFLLVTFFSLSSCICYTMLWYKNNKT